MRAARSQTPQDRATTPATRILALDYGSARCGCAVSDPTGVIATPLEVIAHPGSRRGLAAIVELATQWRAAEIVVGLPLSLSGADTAQTGETRGFAQTLQRRLPGTPVHLHDERYTTRIANRLAEPHTTAPEDSRAAADLLDSWLARRAPPASILDPSGR